MHRRTRMLRICTVVTSRGEGGRGCVGGGCSCHLSAPRSLLSEFEQHVREQRGSKLKNTQWRRRRTHVHLPDLCVSVCVASDLGGLLRQFLCHCQLCLQPHPPPTQKSPVRTMISVGSVRVCVYVCVCVCVVHILTWLVHVCLMLPEVSVLQSYGSMCSASITLDLLAQW